MGHTLQYPTPVSEATLSPFLPRTLAVADDDEVHAELVSAWLEHHGFRVLRFVSGDALVDWASSPGAAADALVLDVDMPGRDGFQSCRDLRALPAFSQVPAVFVSSATLNRVPDEGELIPKDGEMLARLTRWLDERFLAA